MNPLRSGFGTFLKTQNLAKLLLSQAEEFNQKGDDRKALRDLITAVNEMRLAVNNLAQYVYRGGRKIRNGKMA